MTNILTVENLSIKYPLGRRFWRESNYKIALDNVTFSIEDGDKIALVGLNGSGKSTLLRAIAGIYTPSSGSVKLRGTATALFSLGVGMRMELSGRRNIILRGMVNGYSKKDINALTQEIIDFSELEAVIDMPMSSYSQGMAMRLTFAIATALTPDLLLLDEWVGAGDRDFRIKSERRITEMVSRSGAMVLASHNTKLVTHHCNKAAWLDNGKLVAFGPVEDVVERFENNRGSNVK